MALPASRWHEGASFEGKNLRRGAFRIADSNANGTRREIAQRICEFSERLSNQGYLLRIETHQASVDPFCRCRAQCSSNETAGHRGVGKRTFTFASNNRVRDGDHCALRGRGERTVEFAVAKNSLQVETGAPNGVISVPRTLNILICTKLDRDSF